MRRNNPTPSTKTFSANTVDKQLESMIHTPSIMIDNAMKSSNEDLGQWIGYLQKRMDLEEGYQNSLKRITNIFTNESTTTATSTNTSSTNTTASASTSISASTTTHTITGNKSASDSMLTKFIDMGNALQPHRTELLQSMRAQIEVLVVFKKQQDRQRQQHKRAMFTLNDQYLKTRQEEVPIAHDQYMQKCEELEKSQEMVSVISPTAPAPIASSSPSFFPRPNRSNTTMTLPQHSLEEHEPTELRVFSLDEERPTSVISNLSFQTGTATKDSTVPQSPHRRIERFMKQFSNLTHHNDPGRQNIKSAKLKVQVTEADQVYRKAVHKLDALNKKRIAANEYAIKSFQLYALEKSKKLKQVLDTIITAQLSHMQMSQQEIQKMQKIILDMDPDEIAKECEKSVEMSHLPIPQPVYYIHRRVGVCKDLIFGISLADYAQLKGHAPPLIVTKCITAIESLGGLEKEGIYRISGKKSNVEIIKQCFERDEEALVFGKDNVPEEVFSIASILKIFLRELETPLFPFKLSDRITYSQTEKELRLMNLLTRLLKLPFGNYETLKALVEHLSKLTLSVEKNKMSISNLSLIFTPAIFQDHNQAQRSPGEWFSDCVLEDLIMNHSSLFGNKDIQNASSITGGIEYGFDHIHDHDMDSCDFSLSSPSTPIFDYSPTESDRSSHKTGATDYSHHQLPLVEQDDGPLLPDVDHLTHVSSVSEPEHISSQALSPMHLSNGTPLRHSSLDKPKKFRTVSQDRGLKVDTRVSSQHASTHPTVICPDTLPALSPFPVNTSRQTPLSMRESGLMSATTPSYSWLNHEPDLSSTPVSCIRRSTTTTAGGRRFGHRIKSSTPSSEEGSVLGKSL
ncbi:hypothetical protein BDF14DRAFT_1826494 [Spinellus fusiger]|nr:hypothetical protein BDF14DRAFT_1826494 [Spinellus fusiger]